MAEKRSSDKLNYYLSVGPILIVFFLIILGRHFVVSMKDFDETLIKGSNQSEIGNEILFLDEVLTNSARMAVLTGDPVWIDRYNENVKKLDQKIQFMDEAILKSDHDESIGMTAKANALLVEMEERAIELVKNGNKEEARSILFGPFYREQKENYLKGMNNVVKNLKLARNEVYQVAETKFLTGYGAFLVILIFLFALWIFLHLKGLRQRNYYNFDKVSELYALRFKKVLSILSEELKNYITVNESTYGVLLNQLRDFRRLGWTEDKGITSDELRESEERHQQQIGKVDHLVNQLVTVSRCRDINQEAVSIDESIRQAIYSMIKRYRLDWLNYKSHFPKDRLFFYGDPALLTLVLVEVFTNSMESIQGTYRPWVRVEGNEVGDEIILRIIDSGEIIPTAAQKKMFSLFFTTKTNRSALGIGLSISQKIIQELNGKMEYELYENHNSILIKLPKINQEYKSRFA